MPLIIESKPFPNGLQRIREFYRIAKITLKFCTVPIQSQVRTQMKMIIIYYTLIAQFKHAPKSVQMVRVSYDMRHTYI